MRVRPAVWLVALAVLALDQFSKQWALDNLADGRRIALIGDVLGLKLVFNSGAAFSMLEDATWVVTLVMALVIGALVWFHGRAHRWWGVAIFGAALGGALGNLADRLLREPGFAQGHVVDMIAYGDWFVGNIADIAVVLAAAVAVSLGWANVSVVKPAANREPAEGG